MWFSGHFLYVVSNTLVESVGAKLRTNGKTDVSNATGIYDHLQDAGYALKNKRGLAVHTIKITGENGEFENILTVLKFEADRVLMPDHEIEDFRGTIFEIDKKQKNTANEALSDTVEQPEQPAPINETTSDKQKLAKASENTKTEPTVETESEPTAEQTLLDTDLAHKALSLVTPPAVITEGSTEEQGELDVSVQQQPQATVEETPVSETISVTTEAEPSKHGDELDRIARELNNKSANAGTPGKSKKVFAEACALDSPDIGGYFMAWLKDGIINASLSVNTETSQVHILEEGVALVTPKIFKTFIRDKNLVEPGNEELVSKGSARVQNRLRKLGVLFLTPNKHAVHKLAIANSEKSLSAFIVQKKFIYPSSAHNPQKIQASQ